MEHEEDMDGLDPAYVVDMPEPVGESLGGLGAFDNNHNDEDFSEEHSVNGNLAFQTTPSKRGKGLSLADELALAMSPNPSRDEESEDEEDREHTGELSVLAEDHEASAVTSFTGEGLDRQMESLQSIMQASLDPKSDAELPVSREVPTSDHTQSFLSQLRQFSKSDEFLVEKMTSQFIKQMYDLARDREAQIRELREMERIIMRLPMGAHSSAPISFAPAKKPSTVPEVKTHKTDNKNLTLEDLPPPPFSPTEEFSSPADDLQDSLASLLALLPRSSLLTPPSLPNSSSVEPTSDITSSEYPHTPNTPSSTANSPLHSLRHLTDDLVSSLERINEQTQVTRALTSNASRRLKALRGVVVGWKADLRDAEESQAWIEQHELPDAPNIQSRESVKKFVESQMAGFENDLGRASDEMRAILAKG